MAWRVQILTQNLFLLTGTNCANPTWLGFSSFMFFGSGQLAGQKMKKKKLSCSVGFEQLELRRLLAADCCMQAMPEVATTEPAQCEVASFEGTAEDVASDPAAESETDVVDEGTTTPGLDPRVLDLADGMDGYFGAINAENPAETLEFTAVGDGTVDVVLASSFGDAHASLSVLNSQGDVIETQTEGLDGFDRSSFEVEEGETWQLSISSDDATCEGHFQLTVGFEAHVDQHADEMGSKSTELEIVDNKAELSGRLESAGDIDTFRFIAEARGEGTLELHEMVDDARIGLVVGVQDSEGNMLAEGATNEMLQISFDVDDGQEYFVSLAAGEGQKGTYHFGLEMKPAAEQPAAESIDCEVVGETVGTDVADPEVSDPEVSDPELADGQTTDNEVSEPSTGELSDTGIVSDRDDSTVDVDSELVDTNDETAEPDAADEAGATVDPVLPVDCELAENASDVIGSEIIDEPIPGESTDEIASEPAVQQPGDQQSDRELAVSTEEQFDGDLSDAWLDCSGDETIVSDGNSETDLESGAELDPEPVADDVIVAAGDDVNDCETDIAVPVAGLENLEAVDDFFANLENDFELHFDFSFFGSQNFDRISSLV